VEEECRGEEPEACNTDVKLWPTQNLARDLGLLCLRIYIKSLLL
jgi:hypothetical protein